MFPQLIINFLSTDPTKSSNTIKQFVGKLPMNYLSVFNHFVKLALIIKYFRILEGSYVHLMILTLSSGALFTNFVSLVSFYTPWKLQATPGFLIFARVIERDQWHEMGLCLGTRQTYIWLISYKVYRHWFYIQWNTLTVPIFIDLVYWHMSATTTFSIAKLSFYFKRHFNRKSSDIIML